MSSAIALLAFFTGACVGAWSVRHQPQARALALLMTIELILLTLGALLWLAAGKPASGVSGDGVIILLALAMGLQIIAGRQLNLANVPTVVFTSTLANMATGVVESLRRKVWPPRDVWRQGAAILLYFGGALTAGLFVFFGSPAVIFLPAAAVGMALVLLGLTAN
jgi:uncharacterized membrane protein YoaK (UPF0700 family)